MSRPRIIAIMGSGETAPTMIKTHRELFSRLGPDSRGVVLDTPYGFQANAAELAHKAVEYFRQSVGRTVSVAGLQRLKRSDTGLHPELDEVAIEHGLNRVREADFVFAGPGSPTYALHQWSGTPVPEILVDKLRNGGVVTFSSAAALTLGRFTVPVYEIYKVGSEPHWLEGMNVLSEIGLDVAIIPHFDNAEGGHHDTRFCYLGQRRLEIMEDLLPRDCRVIGIDEHTGLVLDLELHTATVVGNGSVTVRALGNSVVYDSGTVVAIDALRTGTGSAPLPSTRASATSADSANEVTASLVVEVEARRVEFDDAMAAGDAESAVRSILELEGAIHRWSADTLQSSDMDTARAVLRSMIVRLGDAATTGLVDPRAVVSPYVEALLGLRSRVRVDKLYDLSDLIRDRLVDLGIDVHDTPNGATWELRSAQ